MNSSINLNTYTSLAQIHSLQAQRAQYEDNSLSPASQETKISSQSRKILKKRTKYNKINDEIRLQLIDAVEKDGEMLKTAAKKFKINYSSAKSIFQTYRKEGRVLRKTHKARRSHKDAVVKKDASLCKTEESSPDKTQMEAPTPENNDIQFKPPKDYLSTFGMLKTAPLVESGLNERLLQFDLKRDIEEKALRLLTQAQPWMASKYLVNQTALLEQRKVEMMLSTLAQRTPNALLQMNSNGDIGLNEINQYYQMKQLAETMRLDTMGQIMKQLVLSNMASNC